MLWLGQAGAWAQEQPANPRSQRAVVQSVLRRFVGAVEQNKVDEALACCATAEDLQKVLEPELAKKRSEEVRARIKAEFPDLVARLKAFGKHDLVELSPGQLGRLRKGQMGAIAEAMITSGAYIAMAYDSNYYIELRIDVGGLLHVSDERWVLCDAQVKRQPMAESPLRKVLADFAAAVEQDDLAAGEACLVSEEDMATFLPPKVAARSARELHSHLKLSFHEFAEAVKAFGSHEEVVIAPGTPRKLRRGEWGAVNEVLTVESGYIAFAPDADALVELRLNIGGVVQISPERWGVTNFVTRADRFATISTEAVGEE